MIVIPTHNPGKLKEFRQLFTNTPLQIQSLSECDVTIPEYIETAETFVENAIGKAHHAARLLNQPVMADDSGLCVAALNGQPGIFSARYAEKNNDAANRAKLLAALKNVPQEKRQAYFYCVLVFMRHAHDPSPIIADAGWQGRIAETEKGENGFGYDPVFFIPEYQCTAAELAPELKNQISHRAQAFKKLMQAFKENEMI